MKIVMNVGVVMTERILTPSGAEKQENLNTNASSFATLLSHQVHPGRFLCWVKAILGKTFVCANMQQNCYL